jgi:hypothetical protein
VWCHTKICIIETSGHAHFCHSVVLSFPHSVTNPVLYLPCGHAQCSHSVILSLSHSVTNPVYTYPLAKHTYVTLSFCHFLTLSPTLYIAYPPVILSFSHSVANPVYTYLPSGQAHFCNSVILSFSHSVTNPVYAYPLVMHTFLFLSFCHFLTLSPTLYMPTLWSCTLSSFCHSVIFSLCRQPCITYPLVMHTFLIWCQPCV